MQSPDVRLVTEAKLASTGVTIWRAATAYKQGQAVLSPTNVVVTALTDFTSGSSYDATKWSVPAFDVAGAAASAQAAAAADASNKNATLAASVAAKYSTIEQLQGYATTAAAASIAEAADLATAGWITPLPTLPPTPAAETFSKPAGIGWGSDLTWTKTGGDETPSTDGTGALGQHNSGDGLLRMRAEADLGGSDHWSAVLIKPNTLGDAGPSTRYDAAADTSYALNLNVYNRGTLYKIVAGVETALPGVPGDTFSLPADKAGVLALKSVGSTHTAYWYPGATSINVIDPLVGPTEDHKQCAWSDQTIPTGNRAGARIWFGNIGTWTVFTDFLASAVVAPSPEAHVTNGGSWRHWQRFERTRDTEWTSPGFFPLGVWLAGVQSSADTDGDLALGLNFYMCPTDNSDPAVIAASKMWVVGNVTPDWIAHADGPTGIAPKIVGWNLGDEFDMTYGPVGGQQKLDEALALLGSPRGGFVYTNFGKGVGFWETDAEAAAFVNRPELDVTSADLYPFTDNDLLAASQFGQLYYTQGLATSAADLDPSVLHLGFNYGLIIRRINSLMQPKRVRPVITFVEVGHPSTQDEYPTITPAEVVAATWGSIIGGAQGIVYFNHSFGGDHETQNVFRDTSDPGNAVLRATVTALNARIKKYAPVLNAPTVDGAVKVSGPAAVRTKIYSGQLYVLAIASSPGTNQQVTFTVPSGTVATVLDESRSIDVTGGAFTDTFADGKTVHLYRIDSPARPVTVVDNGDGTFSIG